VKGERGSEESSFFSEGKKIRLSLYMDMPSRGRMKQTGLILCTLLLFSGMRLGSIQAQSTSDQSESNAFDFAISQPFLNFLEQGKTIQPVLRLKLGAHTARVHALKSDCELHAAGRPQGFSPGWPQAFVSEPPNLCKFNPAAGGNSGTDWPSIFDDLQEQVCDVSGFPRIFTEHAQGGEGSGANPNHVFEIHPALSIKCNNTSLSFSKFLKAFPGMAAIKPTTTASCITQRQLKVRFDSTQQNYVFQEQGGRCGNFAIIEVSSILTESIRNVGNGHSAIARISPDGESVVTLKIYTLAPSEIDSWLASPQHSEAPERLMVHGLFTYDYFAITKVLHPRGQEWQKMKEWTAVPFPLAFVAFGKTDTVPWDREDEGGDK